MSGTGVQRSGNLEELFREAEVLIDYSSQNVLTQADADPTEMLKVISRVVKARAAFDANSLSEEDHAQFMCDFRTLSLACLPVTADSIRDSLDEKTGTCRQYIWWGRPITAAAAVVRRITLCSFLALVTLLGVQIIWLMGYDLLDRIDTLQKADAAAELDLAQTKVADPEAAKALARKREDDEMKREGQMESVSSILSTWVSLFGQGGPKKEAATPDQSQNVSLNGDPAGAARKEFGRNLVFAKLDATVLQTYVLPLLYGFLGACTYVLRQLNIVTKAHTFRSEMEIGYLLRIFLGILAGLAIGWFLRPDPEKDGMLHGLTPFALSFLAGYSVEVLFSGMDRLVSAFGSTTQASRS